MVEQQYKSKYFTLLRDYFEHPSEDVLMACAELGRELLKADCLIEGLVEIHEAALQSLAQQHPDVPLVESIRPVTVPLMEMIMSHGMFYRQQMEEIRQLSVTRDLVGQILRGLSSSGGISGSNMHIAGQQLAADTMSETLEDALELFSAMGLGTLELAEVDEERGRWTFTGHNLVEIDRGAKEPTCNYIRGFLYHIIQQVSGSDKVADIETACQSMGATACCFVVQALDE